VSGLAIDNPHNTISIQGAHMTRCVRQWALAVLTIGALTVVAWPAGAQAPIVGIMPRRGSLLCPRPVVRFGPPGDGAPIEQAGCNADDPYQQWYAVYWGRYALPGHSGLYPAYAIVNATTGMCLDVTDGLSADGSPVQQWTCYGNLQQLWIQANQFDDYHQLRSVRSGKCLSVPYNGVETILIIRTCTDFNNLELWFPPI
jgi:hypothetical protein